MMIKAWSPSRLAVFEQCPLRAKLAFIDKIPEPERPLPPGKTEHPNDRGTRVHKAAELFVQGGVELIPELEKFRAELENLRALYAAGKVSLEGEWAFDQTWRPVSWFSSDVWGRVKLDAMVLHDPEHAVVIDYKTGKREGNQLKHAEQGQIYAIVALDRNPNLEEVVVELWYTDQDELVPVQYKAAHIVALKQRFEPRAAKMTMATEFPAKPSIFNCKWCPYKPTEKGGTGHCKVGV